MKRGRGMNWLAGWITVLGVAVGCLCGAKALADEAPRIPAMPAHWKVVSDFQVPAEQVKAMSGKLGADLSSVRNVVYDVNGQRVQINLMVTPDPGNAEKLMTKLRTMKVEAALLQKGLMVYEFVGQNDVLPAIAEGRRHLEAM